MTTFTLKKIPDELYARIKERAARHHRSINSEILASLEEAILLPPPPRDPGDNIREAEELNRHFPVPASVELIEQGERKDRASLNRAPRFPPPPLDPEEAIREAEDLNHELGVNFSAEAVQNAKREGRVLSSHT